MPLLTIGINHTSAPVALREQIAFAPERMADALRELTGVGPVNEAAIISTCNRTELYCGLENLDDTAVIDWLSRYHSLSRAEIEPFLYRHPDSEAVRHILRVASGLDSMILGEPQILGQVKDAYRTASNAGTLGRLLGKLFQHTFSVAKQVRTDTSIGTSAVSVAFAAVSLAKQIFGDMSRQTALLIGAGETIELVARHLHENQIGRMIVANRTAERAHRLAAQFDGYAIALKEMPTHLPEADIVISSTASQLPILGKGAAERAIKQRKHRPILMVDIAVPRDIEPEVGELDDVYLYTVDDLQEVIEENLRSRREAAKQAEEIIDVQTSQFMNWLRSLGAIATICTYRDNADAVRQEVLNAAMRRLQRGNDPALVLQWLAHSLTNKLIHAPSTRLREAGMDGQDELLEAARELFRLKR
ncbi:MAG: glutamyl-tRNA reductase [Proteobacteria bacterium]|nr:MAG: glutamyl-tRNA reductase [Pseudomonadota bacterium]QKK11352.1 MAG: glutamyl-tRNA reductase [Pseudomonadota bacterium]